MYEIMSRFCQISIVTAVGISSFWAGKYFDDTNDKKVKFMNNILDKPTVYAKSLTLEDSQLPLVPPAPTGKVTETKTSRIGQIMKYGFPSLDNIRSFDDFVLSYDRRNRVPNWVFEHLTPESVKFNEKVDRGLCEFHEDESIHPYFRSYNTDYKRSGFDRGHLAAAGNHKQTQELCNQTFVLSNMAPQVGVGFNRNAWSSLEKYTRKLTKKFPNVYVCTGPLYLPRVENDGLMYIKYRVIGENTVAVPTHFFKIMVMEDVNRSVEVEAYVMPNQVISDDTPLANFRVPPESIERASGLLFFERLQKSSIRLVNGKKATWK